MDSISLTSILLRKGIRSDKIWGSWLLFREPFRRIPFYMDVYALSKSQYWPREKLKELQMERFAAIVKNASHIPFWKERFQKAGINPNNFHESDIALIPILTKKDFLDREVSEYTVPELLPKSRKYSTSGSTGQPLAFYHDEAFELRSSATNEFMFRTAGKGKRYPIIYMKSNPYNGFEYLRHHFFYVRGYNGIPHRIQELQKLILSFPHKVILFAMGSSLIELARTSRELNMHLPLQGAIAAGEALHAHQKKNIEDTFGVPVQTTYATNEIRRLAFECLCNRLHLIESNSYIEITDDGGTPILSGTKGRIVVTSFENKVMPFIRYNTGDIGIIHNDTCSCGRTSRTLEFQGRQVRLLNIDGRSVYLLNFSWILDEFYNDIRQFQIVRTDECTFLVRVIPTGQFDKERVQGQLVDKFRYFIHPNVQIEWEIVDSILEGPNGKAVYFIDNFEKDC